MKLPIRASDGTVIRAKYQRWIHPQTKEVYGGTDYDDPKKCAEIGAVEHVDPIAEPSPAPTEEQIAARKTDLRESRYRLECDPHLLAALGYDLEIAAEKDEAKKVEIASKREKEANSYLTKKAAIRAEVA
jgi:hypothetical protein